MLRLWQVLLLCWATSPVCLPSRVRITGTPQECAKAPFVPGYNLGGEGFDIVTMERKGAYVIDTETWKLGNDTCRLYRNSYADQQLQKVPVAVVDWRTLPKCSLKVSGTAYDSVETLVNDSTSSVSNDWKVGLEIPAGPGAGVGGSHSKEAKFGMEKSKQDHYNFYRHSVYCSFYSYRMATKPPLSPEFKSDVSSLPSYSQKTETAFLNLIDTYGTHYIQQVSLGGQIKAITSVRTCQASLSGLTETDVKDCLTVEASYSFSSVSVKAMAAHCQAEKKKLGHDQSFSSTFSERNTKVIGGQINDADVLFQGQSNPSVYNNWLVSLKTTPDVVKYNLKPIHTILPSGHPAQAGLKEVVEKYIAKNAVLKKCSETCQIGHRSSKRDPCACVCNSNQNVRSNCCPAGKGLATLKVFKLYAQGLYGDKWTKTDGSVEVRYGDDKVRRTNIINNNDNPKWSETFEFGAIQINMKNLLKFAVYDQDTYWNSDLLGECSFKPRRGVVSEACMFNHGTFFFSYEVECAPSLSGDHCQEYIPSAMSPSLAKVFYTRNGVLLGETG
ncbi:perforin-1-like [Centropristis striata]|uniref:perforin-1-like n=1 Tax=Centropristis striata TaxID=184440 RepID=UPI0027DF5F03|nr:perforin-1-like [Centropristis striata]